MSSQPKKSNAEIQSIVIEWVKSIGIAFLTTFFVTTFIFSVAEVKGDSMYPTLQEGDRLILKKYEVVLKTEEYQRGDLIIFDFSSENKREYFIKRVIGIPGDIINISNGKLHINGIQIEEPYIEEDSFTASLSYGDNYFVLENALFVIGDNRLPGKSYDSRSFGSISFEDVEGKIVLRFLPIDKIEKEF